MCLYLLKDFLIPNNILGNPLVCFFVTFWFVSLTFVIYKPDYLRDLTIFTILFISSLGISNIALLGPNIYLLIAASVADAAAVIPNGFKALLTNGLSTFPIKHNPAFSNGPKSLPRNPPYCPILCNWLFDNFILTDETFGEALRSLETSVLVNSNICRKLFPSLESPITFDKNF